MSDSSQPPPIVHDGPFVKDRVLADIEELCGRRAEKYGSHLQAHNGRDALQDAYEEALDMALYLKQAIMERDGATSTYGWWQVYRHLFQQLVDDHGLSPNEAAGILESAHAATADEYGA